MKKHVYDRDQRLITDGAVEDYLDSLCPGNSAVLEEIRSRAEQEDIPVIRRGSEELLKTALTMHRPKSILEIGTAVGYSALVMAQTLPDADIVTLEIGAVDYEKALENIAAAEAAARDDASKDCASGDCPPGDEAQKVGSGRGWPRIDALHLDANDYLVQAIDEGRRFDFVFLDAAKAQYIVWLPMILRLLADGGVLLADNVLLGGTIACSRYALDRRERTTHQRMRDFLYAITHDARLTTAVIPSGDGISISVYHEQAERRII